MQKIETVGKTYMAAGGLKSLEIKNMKGGLHPVQRVRLIIKLWQGNQLSTGYEKAPIV
jgi:hypothetical protein